MRSGSNIVISAVAGAVGGALVMLLVLNSPQAPRFFVGKGTSENGTVTVSEVAGEGELRKSYESLVVQAVEKSNPAVVSIIVTKDVPIMERFFEELPGQSFDPFGDFFGDNSLSPFSIRVPQLRQRGTEKREVGGGSGFLISQDGMIITNRHVVDEDDVEYTVFLNDGTKLAAQIVARDPVNDLAVIRVEGSNLPFLEFADSDSLRVGQSVIVIGNALAEFRNTVSVGVISGLSRSIVAGNGQGQSEQLEEVIQTDAAINPGNSGGPLLNLEGKVIGVNVAIALGSENIGFALPVNLVRGVVKSVNETGKIVRPFLGVRYTNVTPPLQEANRLSVDYGVLVVRGDTPEELAVVPGSPADKADIEEGDIILEVDGVKLDEGTSLAAQIRKRQVGDAIQLKILHEGQERQINVTLEEVPQ